MINKKYAFPSEEMARLLISTIGLNGQYFNQFVRGVEIWGFEHKYSDDEEPVIIKEGTTYNVDIGWKVEPFSTFEDYEITPETPSHKFA